MFNTSIFLQKLRDMQEQAPLVHCMTNDVVNNFTANVLLAIGAMPAMVVAQEESAEFAAKASALLVNVGTLTPTLAQSMSLAVASAKSAGVPWVLDPVAYGVLAYRSQVCLELLRLRPTVIRGNAAEIMGLSGIGADVGDVGLSKGVDSLASSHDALNSAKELAKRFQCIVTITGEVDYVTDGEQTWALKNGHVQLTRVTGTGCALGAMVAAYCAVCDSPVQASLCAMSHIAIAGELAVTRSQGVGSFAVALLDELQLLVQSEKNVQRLSYVLL